MGTRKQPIPRCVRMLVVWLAMIACSSACTSPATARRVLEDAGYAHISIGGYGWFSCGDDGWSTKFTAIGPTGRRVSGVVCQGLLKGATIRFD